MAAAAAPRRLEDFGVVGREQGPLLPLMAGLAAAQATGGQARRAALDSGRGGGGRPRGVGGVLVQPLLQPSDQVLLLADRGPQLSHLGPQRQNQGSGFGRQTAP